MEKIVVCTVCSATLTVFGQVDNSREVDHSVTCLVCGTPNEVYWPMNCGWSVKTRCPECGGTGSVGIAMFTREGLDVNAGGRHNCDKCGGTGQLLRTPYGLKDPLAAKQE